MATLLIVHHSPSSGMRGLLEAAVAGASADGIEGVRVEVRPALEATTDDVLAADGYVLGTPANLGYMSGALKHFFDTVYNDCLDVTVGRPFGFYVHGATDTTGAVRSIEMVTTGLQWRPVADPVSLIGGHDQAGLDEVWNLAATVAATLMDL